MAFIKFLMAIWRALRRPALNVGDTCIFDEFDINPFAKPPAKVEIKAVKNGYVNYKFLGCSSFQNESISVGSFHFCYKRINSHQ